MEVYSTAIGKLKNLEKLALEFYKYVILNEFNIL